ncbi:lipocalin family protein [Wenyingzhuangia sp. IMCC45467]
MKLLKFLAILIVAIFTSVACTNSDDNDEKDTSKFPSETEVPTDVNDINPGTDEQEDVPEGGLSIVGYWIQTSEIHNGSENDNIECPIELKLDHKKIVSIHYMYDENAQDCVVDEDDGALAAYNRDGNKLYLTLSGGGRDELTVEVSENELHLSGTDEDGTWTDVFMRNQQ